MRAVVKRGPTHPPNFSFERWLTWPEPYNGFQGRIDYLRDRLVDLVWERRKDGPVVGYGATAKSATLLNYCRFGPNDIAFVEDLTPTKVGRYTPGTHIPIRSPKQGAVRRKVGGEPLPTYLALAWNYLPGILARESAFRDAGGRFIVPIPQPVLL